MLQAFACITVSLSSFIPLAFEPFIFSGWGILGAALWILSQLTAMNGFSMISIAVASPLVAGITIVVAFIWGVSYFGDAVISMVGCVFGIVVIFLGMVGVAMSASSVPDKLWARLQGLNRPSRGATAAHISLTYAADDDE